MKLVVYIDVYFLINGIFDFCILLLTGRIQKCRQRLFRLLAAATAGGLGASMFLLFSVWLSGLCGILQYGLLPVLMIFISFGFSDKKTFFCQLLTFYAMTFLLGGALVAFRKEGKGILSVLMVTAVIELFLWILFPILQRRHKELQNEYEIAISFGKDWIKGKALLDTGNRLREPFSQKPVVLAEVSAVKEGFPEELKKVFEDMGPEIEKNLFSEEYTGMEKIRWIPYHAIGTDCGLIPGVEAAQMKIWSGKKCITKEGIMLGLVFKPLAAQGEYHFILHEDIMC